MAEPKTGSEHGARKATRGASNSTWRKMFACCVKAEEDDVQVLDYEHSSLSDVPAEVFAHERTLEVLRLDCNQISDLPRPLFHCHGLKELYLSDNEIAQLPPALASLIHLQVLDVSKNALAEIPDAISGLKALTTLDLSVNPIGKLPEGATKLLSLESLNLSDTFLEFLPANFGRLTKLRLLELRENQLVTLPKSMARLTNLRRLDLGQNELSNVPEVVGSLPSLCELWLDGNKLDILPDFIGHLPNLTHLDASRNVLGGIAPSIGLCRSLTDLSLTSNNLVELPEEIGDLTQLVVLRVDDNQLVSLPDSIGRLAMLEELEAGQNQIARLPPSIGLLRKLETLMLNENQLEELPPELGSCQRLTVLSVRKNRLERMPPEIGQLSRLRVVNLSCNRLQYLPVSFLKLPSLTALWLSEAQTKPVVPLQTDTDANTGHKVLTCFLLPQTEEHGTVEKERGSPNAATARSPTHIKFAFDGESDKLAGRLTRNPTPYPKELKALARHAQHVHQQSSPARAGVEAPPADVHRKKDETVASSAAPSTAPTTVSTAYPVLTSYHLETKEAAVKETLEAAVKETTVTVLPKVGSFNALVVSGTTSEVDGIKSLPKVEVSAVTRAESLPAVEPAQEPPKPASDAPQRLADVEIKEARVMRPLKSANEERADDKTSELPVGLSSLAEEPKGAPQPPPYHVAAALSKRAAEFSQALPRTQSTDSGFTIEGVAKTETDDRDASPSRDSGRGPSIEPLEETAAVAQAASSTAASGPAPDELDRVTPLLSKRSTYIIDDGTSSAAETFIEENGPQSVAALRQAARDVFRESPLPPHKFWDGVNGINGINGINGLNGLNGAAPLSAANVVGLPTSENSCPPLQPHGSTKIQGRLPAPKISLGSLYRDANETKSPPVETSRIPLSSHNRLPSGLPRQLSNLSSHGAQLNESMDSSVKSAPVLPPKKESIRRESTTPTPPTLLPKLSTSRIPPPQVHAPAVTPTAAPLTPLAGKTSFSPLPVHNARLVTPSTPNGLTKPALSASTSSTRIPLPKYSAAELKAAGPSPVSRIPTRLPTPTSNPALKKLSDDRSASPSLAAYPSRIH